MIALRILEKEICASSVNHLSMLEKVMSMVVLSSWSICFFIFSNVDLNLDTSYVVVLAFDKSTANGFISCQKTLNPNSIQDNKDVPDPMNGSIAYVFGGNISEKACTMAL